MSERLVCGLQPVREAIRARGDTLRVLVEAEAREPSPQLEALARFARDHGARVERPSRAELDRVTRGVRHQGAVAFAIADYGTKFMIVAGLLNFIAVADAYHIAIGKKQ